VGLERPRDAPDLLPPRAQGRAERREAVRDRPAPHELGDWAEGWLGLDVGSDIALANGVAHEILRDGLENREFIERATSGFEAYREHVLTHYPLERVAKDTGVDPATVIREIARDFARADRAMICWTLGITEHHNAVDNVLSLINLALLTGHVGQVGLGPQPAARPEQRAGRRRHGRAAPQAHRLPGRRGPRDPREVRARVGREDPAEEGLAPDRHVRRDGARGADGALRDRREPRAVGGRRSSRVARLLEGLEVLVVQDIFLTRTAELADVVLPATASFAEADGTFTNSERRVQRVRRAVAPPAGARDDIAIIADLSRRLGRDLGEPTPEELWNELRALSPMHAGMTYEKLERLGGIQWPCPDDASEGSPFLHGRLWAEPLVGPRAPLHVTHHEGPAEALDDQYPLRLTTGRRLSSFNTGVQSGSYKSPLRRGETLDLCQEDAARLGVSDGEVVRVSSRRGSVTVPARVTQRLRPGLVFMTFHFPNEVDTNVLTIDATDPNQGPPSSRRPPFGSTSSLRPPPQPNNRGPTPHPREADRRRARRRRRGRWPRRPRPPDDRPARGARHATPAAAGAARGAGALRLDPPRRARVRVRAAARAPR
jgi:predicted molibdopterin-dependent oxidoreductase YjgC